MYYITLLHNGIDGEIKAVILEFYCMPNSITLKSMHMIIGNYKVITVAYSELNFCEGG